MPHGTAKRKHKKLHKEVCVCVCMPGSSNTPASMSTPSALVSTSKHHSPIKGARAPQLVVDSKAEMKKAQAERMSLEHLEVLKSKEAFKCDRNNRKITGTILKELQVFKARTMCTAK